MPGTAATPSAETGRARDERMTFSVIIEWENVKLSELQRARAMLAALAAQSRALGPTDPRPRDLVVLHDPELDADPIRHTVEGAMGAPSAFERITVLPVADLHYYELKNHGAAQTDADVVVFLDSDVIPEPGWLERLLRPIVAGESDVVGGNTYIQPDTLYTKAFALFWFFPLRSDLDELRLTHHFFANNVAFRRSLFEAHHFPEGDTFRGQCVRLANELDRAGFTMHLHEGARVSHPPPNGIRHFVARALCAGHDTTLYRKGSGQPTTLRSALGDARRQLRDSRARITDGGATLGLGPVQRILAMGIATTYHAFTALGQLVTRAFPGVIPRYFPI